MRANRIIVAAALSLVMGVLLASHAANRPGNVRGRQASDAEPVSIVGVDSNFDKMMRVLSHQRCTNCHPSDGIPKQGDDAHPHYFGIARGQDNHGFEAIRCNTCHQSENNEFSGVPGAPQWSLAPDSMRWEGLSRTEIAESILDRKRNGNRSHEQIMHHLTEHALVLWAWEPGVDADGTPREPPPVPKDEYIAAVKSWFAEGAVIPKE